MNRKKLKFISFITFFLIFNFSCYIKKQEFSVYNFKKIDPKTFVDSSGIRFMYDLKLKHFFYKSPSYYIYTELYDKNSNLVYTGSQNNQITIFGNKEDWDSISENLQIFIPYDKLNVPFGEHDLELRMKVEGKRAPSGFIFNEKIKVSKPELFHYKDQKITVKDHKVHEEYRDLIIDLNFDLHFKAYQTIGYSENTDLQNCYFKANLYNKKDGEIIQYASQLNPTLVKVNADTIFDKSCIFSISFTNLKLPPGHHDLTCKIHLSNSNYDDLGVLYEIDFPFNLPQLYINELHMKKVEVINKKKYDVSSLVGRIFSRKDKNRGEGYPDVYWEIKTNNGVKYKSEVENNSYTGYPGEAVFITDDNEKIYLSVCDADIEFFNDYDLIGRYTLENKKGQFTESFTAKKIGNAECTFDFKKIKYNPEKHYYKISGK